MQVGGLRSVRTRWISKPSPAAIVDRSSCRIYALMVQPATLHNGDENMAIETSWENGILIVRAEERLDSVNAQVFMDRLDRAAEGAAQGVVMDMSRLVYISHAGLRVILQAVRSMEQEYVRLALCDLSPDVRHAFHASGLDQVVDIRPSRADALATVNG